MTRASVRRVLGPIAMAIGLIGLVLSLLLIPFAWIVRAPAVDALDSAVARVDDAADRARSVSNELADRVGAAQASAASVAAAADALLAAPAADDAALNGFAGIVEQRLIQPIGQARQRLTSVRVALTTAAAVRDSLGAVLPGAAPSDESVTGLSALAGRLEAVDAALGSASERLAVAAGVPRTVAIGAARAAASRVATALDTAGQAIAQVQ